MNRPNIAISVLLGIVAIPSMLAVNWMLAPQIISQFSSIEHFGPIFFAASSGQLVADFLICFCFASLLMYAVQLRPRPHGTAIAACMAFVGWAVYFMEVGYFTGMLHSEYPLWYEALSFIKYPSAFVLSFFLRKRARLNIQPDEPASGGSAG